VRRLVRLLLSRTLAIALMVALAAILALASLVPDDLAPARREELRRARPAALFLAEALRPGSLTRSPGFVALAALVFASTAASTVDRARRELARRRAGRPPGLERFRAARVVTLPAPPSEALAAARRALPRGAWTVLDEGEGALRASRGGAGFLGSLAFHAGILVTLAGITASALTRASGELMLVEGFPVGLGRGAVVHESPPGAFAPLAGTEVAIRDFSAEYQGAFTATDVSAVFEARRPGAPPREEVVRVNQGTWLDDAQLTLHRYGFAPGLAVRAGDGQVLAEGVAILTVLPPGTEDGLPLADGSELRLRLFPDYVPRRDGSPASRSALPEAPVLEVRRVVGGREVGRGLVARGAEAAVGGVTVRFDDVRYWAEFLVGRDRGLWAFGAGCLLVAAGLAVRFGFDPRAVRIAAAPAGGGSRLELVSSARWFPALNEERAERLAGLIAAAGGGTVAAPIAEEDA
jgi:hypothetical protein